MVHATPLRPTVLQIPQLHSARAPCRCKSITAAIERGRNSWDGRGRISRETQSYQPDGRVRSERDDQNFRSGRSARHGPPESARAGRLPHRLSGDSHDEILRNRGQQEWTGEISQQAPGFQFRPESLPYTTAASEFIYGYSSVLAALKAHRRKLYKLYVHQRGVNQAGKDALYARARTLRPGVRIKEVGDKYLPLLDKASSGRPHNGFVLEASPLPVPPLVSLLAANMRAGTFGVALDRQSREDTLINGTQSEYNYKSAGWRHPLVLYVDGVLDEGNLGAIARSAYFLGVDAMVTPTRQSAPWSHIAVKASAGAAEAIPIFKVASASEFLGQSARGGWRIYASDSVPPAEQPALSGSLANNDQDVFPSSVIYTQARSAKRLAADHCPVALSPTILMMGAEGTGLRSSLLNLAHFKVGIRHGRDENEIGVDSLNVSVAASILCYDMLQKPKPRTPAGNLLF